MAKKDLTKDDIRTAMFDVVKSDDFKELNKSYARKVIREIPVTKIAREVVDDKFKEMGFPLLLPEKQKVDMEKSARLVRWGWSVYNRCKMVRERAWIVTIAVAIPAVLLWFGLKH